MTWDGEERRKVPTDNLTGVRAELNAVKTALLDVANGLTQVAPRAEVEAMVNTERRARARFQAAIAVGVVVAILSIFVSIAQLRDLHNRSVRNRAASRMAAELTYNAVNCILSSLNLHREANEFAHREVAAKLKIPYDEPEQLIPPKTSDELKQSCMKFNESLGRKP